MMDFTHREPFEVAFIKKKEEYVEDWSPSGGSNEIVFIKKEEFVEDWNPSGESNKIVFIKKEEFVEDWNPSGTNVKEEVASICDVDIGFDSEAFPEDRQCSLGSVENHSLVLENLDQDGSQTFKNELQFNRKRRRQRKVKRQVELIDNSNKCLSKRGVLTPMAKEAKLNKNEAEKYQRQKSLAAARQRRYKANMSEEELEKKRRRDRERYYRLKNENKIKNASDMNAGELIIQRKKWRKSKAEQKRRKEEERKLVEDTPENSENKNNYLVATTKYRQKKARRKAVKQDMSKMYRELKKITEENEIMRRELIKYKKMLEREKNKGTRQLTKHTQPL